MQVELNSVYTFTLTNANELVAKVVGISEDSYTVSNPLSAVPTEKGIQLIFAIFTADPSEDITINKSAVAMISKTRLEICDHYLEATTGIKAVRSSKILLG